MDMECIKLCEAMNTMPGIRTTESCCGHNKDNFHIWFDAENLDSLPALLYWFAGCHCGHYDWRVTVKTDCAMNPVSFCVEGPVGAYNEADDIACFIID